MLEARGFVSGAALVTAYRWSSRCLHAALRGRFRVAAGPGGAAGAGAGALSAQPSFASSGGGGGAVATSSGGTAGGGGSGGAGGGALSTHSSSAAAAAAAAGASGASAPLCDGVASRCVGGVELLESRSPSHVNVVAAEPMQSGRHVWTVHVRAACDLVWLGVSDGTLDAHVWVSVYVLDAQFGCMVTTRAC